MTIDVGLRCPACRAPAAAEARFCGQCGTDLPVPAAGDPQPIQVRPAATKPVKVLVALLAVVAVVGASVVGYSALHYRRGFGATPPTCASVVSGLGNGSKVADYQGPLASACSSYAAFTSAYASTQHEMSYTPALVVEFCSPAEAAVVPTSVYGSPLCTTGGQAAAGELDAELRRVVAGNG